MNRSSMGIGVNCSGQWRTVLLLLCGMMVACLLIVSEDASAVDRPTEPGPYSVGYFDVMLNGSQGGLTVDFDCRYYYPAISPGEDADPDSTGAPYPPVIHHVFMDELFCDERKYNKTNDRERIEFLVSHGFVVLTFTPKISGGLPPGPTYYGDFVNHTDSYNENVSSLLYGIIKTDAYGALGENFGASMSMVHACFTDRLVAVHSLGPVFGPYDPDMHDVYTAGWNSEQRAWMVQRGDNFTYYDSGLFDQYDVLNPGKIVVSIPGGEMRGPYREDLIVAFFMFHLGGRVDYETFIYGDASKNEVYTGQYGMVFNRTSGETFWWEPTFTVEIASDVDMDYDVPAKVNWDMDIILEHPTVSHGWYLLGDEEVLMNSSLTDPNMTVCFTEPTQEAVIRYRYKIGLISIDSDNVTLVVQNVQPEASIEKPKDGSHRDKGTDVEFIGWGRDTPSDNDTLWYIWNFDDGTTAQGASATHSFKEPGRYEVTLTVEDDHGASVNVTHVVNVESEPPTLVSPIIIFTSGIAVILIIVGAAATEPGKYWFGLLGGPLYVKTKDVLDNKTRLALHGIIVENPGIHYSAIREEFGLANGQAAYHLHVLERESFIRSIRDGKLKRFYSAHSKVPKDVGRSPEETRKAIIELIKERPGINQLEVMEELGLDRASASYYLRELEKEGRLKAGKEGWYTVYTVKGRK